MLKSYNKIEIIEIKTPNCMKCKFLEPQWKQLQQEMLSLYPNIISFKELVLSVDPQAASLVKEFNIKSAPSFIIILNEVDSDNYNQELIKLEDIEKFIYNL